MRKSDKPLYIIYEDDQIVCGKTEHIYGYVADLETAKAKVRHIKIVKANAKNIRVFDTEQEDENGNAVMVYCME